MSQRLNLTEDQKEKIRPVLQDESKQLKALHEDTSLTPEQRRAKAREIHRATREQINPILTPEQQEQLKEMHRRRPRGTGQGQGPGGPQKP
jgi:protein CpxP